MPFFYSQYLNNESKKPPKPPDSKASRLVWHSNTGSSGKRRGSGFKPLSSSRKCVHFATVEVQPFHFDWSLADQIWYSREELAGLNEGRFGDAEMIRAELDPEYKSTAALDDADLVATKTTIKDVNEILEAALDGDDENENVSIRGIEHFVFPDLQQEMIKRKKEQHGEVLQFVKDKRPDPQGWRLAEHSRSYSQWARDVALEKGIKYSIHESPEGVENGGKRIESVVSASNLKRLTTHESR